MPSVRKRSCVATRTNILAVTRHSSASPLPRDACPPVRQGSSAYSCFGSGRHPATGENGGGGGDREEDAVADASRRRGGGGGRRLPPPGSTPSPPAPPSTRRGSARGSTCCGAARRWSASSASSPQRDQGRSFSPPPPVSVPYYLAEMTEQVVQEDRIPILKASQDHLKVFISICEALELIPQDELQLSRQKQPDTAANRRAQKIARFNCQKAAQTKLQEIKERKERRVRSLRAAALSAPIEAGEEDVLEDDGEEERRAWLATVSLALCKKEEETLVAVKERQAKGGNAFACEMLDERTQKAETWHQNAATRALYAKPADPINCATFAQDVIEGRASVSQAHEHKPLIFGPASLVGGGLTTERERMGAQVFEPSYRMPTMSI